MAEARETEGTDTGTRQEQDTSLLPELVAHLHDNRSELRQEWASRIHDAHLLSAMTPQEVFSEVTSVYDNYVEVLETGSVEELRRYARDLSGRIIPRDVETRDVIEIVLLLRDVLARSLFEKYRDDFGLLNRVLNAYEPAANRIAITVAGSFVEERERIIRQQQDSLRELSTPVLQVRERLLILPIIGVLDTARAHQLTDQLLHAIRTHRARVVVIDITGVPDVDEAVADHLVKTVDASRLMGAGVIITGLSSEIAQTLVTIGVDLSKMNTVGDLQGGIEEAERLLGSGSSGRMMPDAVAQGSDEPLRVSILTQGGHLIASIHTALDDGQLLRFRNELLERIGTHRSHGVIIDVAALDVIDSFACHTLRSIAQVARLRGADTVIVGIKPDVALAMVQLGASLEPVRTALDLEAAFEQLAENEPSAPFTPGAAPR